MFTTTNGKHIPLLDILGVVENESEGSVEVSYGSSEAPTKLTGQNAHAFRLATDSSYRAQQEEQQQSGGKPALELWREGAFG